jgi:cold shock CspA family protein
VTPGFHRRSPTLHHHGEPAQADRAFGFIAPDDGREDVFVRARTLEMSGSETLNRGDRVEFERVPDNRGCQAYRLRWCSPST